jgi:hypothetical protein
MSTWPIGFSSKDESEVENRYVNIGMHRAAQGVPFSELFSMASLGKEHIWEYIPDEC